MKNNSLKYFAPLLLATSIATAEDVSLKFDWQPGLRCAVSQNLKTSNDAALQLKEGSNSRWTLTTAAAKKDLLVRVSDYQSGQPGTQFTEVKRLEAETAYLVSRDGEFRKTENLRELKRAMAKLGAQPGAAGQLAMMYGATVTQESLDNDTSGLWLELVGPWRKAPLTTDQPRDVQARFREDDSDDGATQRASMTVSAPAACPGAAANLRCVTIVTTREPPTLSAEEIAQNQKTQATGNGRFYPQLQIVRTLVTEVDTLVPHSLVVEARDLARKPDPDGKPKLDRRREVTYVCESKGARP